jgi:hypothetical protein
MCKMQHSYVVFYFFSPIVSINVASNIREASARIKYLVQAVRENGAIDELAIAADEVVIAARDSTKEINQIAKPLRESSIYLISSP